MTATVGARVIAGRYRLESLLGEGGMASVWCAIDTTLERRVAVKLLFARDERHHGQRINRFKREARIAAAVQHPNVVSIVDFGTTEEDQPYMVMEMLSGQSLAARLKRQPRLSLEELVRIAASILRGLDAVHAAGIMHRDIKPENIFLHWEGDRTVPKILDFGISSLVHADGQRTSAYTTRQGILVGTPEYMSPEQCRGSNKVDLRTDIYSIGVVLFEALVGKPPFEAENKADLLIAIVKGTPPSLAEQCPDLPKPIVEIIEKAMARKPEERWNSAGEMRDALLAALDLGPSPSDRPLLAKNEKALRDRARAAAPAPAPEKQPRDEAAEPRAALASSPQAPAQAPVVLARRARRFALLATAAAAAMAGLALWLSQRSPAAGASAPAREPVAEVAPPPAPPPAAPAPALPSTVAVELRGVPGDARVTVDGEPSLQVPLRMPRDGSDRVIRVSAKGRKPWQVVHRASVDGAYDVVLRPAGATREATAPHARPRKQAAAAQPGAELEPPQALQRLDF